MHGRQRPGWKLPINGVDSLHFFFQRVRLQSFAKRMRVDRAFAPLAGIDVHEQHEVIVIDDDRAHMAVQVLAGEKSLRDAIEDRVRGIDQQPAINSGENNRHDAKQYPNRDGDRGVERGM